MEKTLITAYLYLPIHKSANMLLAAICVVCSLFAVQAVAASRYDKKFSESYKRLEGKSVVQLDRLGKEYKKKGDLDNALLCYIIIAGRYDDSLPQKEWAVYSRAYNDIGIIYFTKARYSESFEAFTRSAELSDSTELPGRYNNIASLYYYFNDYDNARLYLEKAYAGSIRRHDMNSLYNVMRNRIEVGMATGRLEDLSGMLSQYCSMTRGTKSGEELFTRRLCQGVDSLIAGRYSAALSSFSRALGYTDKIWLGKVQDVTVRSYMSKTYAMSGDTLNAIRCLKGCEATASAGNMNDMLIDVYKHLGTLYRQTGNVYMAGVYRGKYLELKDSIFSNQELRRMKDFRFNTEMRKYVRRVDALNAAAERRSMVMTSVSVGLAAVLLLLLWVYRQYRMLKRKNVALYTKNVELLRAEGEERAARRSYALKTEALQRRISELEDAATPAGRAVAGKYHGSGLGDDSRNILVERIRQAFDTPDQFCSSDFSLEKLAVKVGSNVRYVSQVINESIGTNFNTLLNSCRVREACRRLSDTATYGNMTLEAVAQSVGFKSHSHFCRIFKGVTGLTPSGYLRMAREERPEQRGL